MNSQDRQPPPQQTAEINQLPTRPSLPSKNSLILLAVIFLILVGGTYLVASNLSPQQPASIQPQNNQPTSQTTFSEGQEVTIQGTVAKNATEKLPVDDAAILSIQTDNGTIEVLYHPGEAECKNRIAQETGLNLKTGERIEVYGEYSQGAIRTCDSELYYIHKEFCGDNVCQEVVCTALGCPKPETPQSCPQDCKTSSPTPTSLSSPSPSPNPTDTFSFPDELRYTPKPDWNVVTAKDSSSKFDFPESFKLYVTSFDDNVECKPLTEEDIRRRQSLTVEDFVTSIQVYGFRLNGQSLEDAVNNPRKTRLNGIDIIYGGSITEKGIGNPPLSPIGEKKLISNGKQAIYHLHKWPLGKPYGTLYRHRIYVQKGNNFIVLTMFVTEPFHQKRFDEIVGVLSSLR